MRRRNFVTTTLQSSIAVSVGSTTLGSLLDNHHGIQQWWLQLRRQLNAPFISFASHDSNLTKCIKNISTSPSLSHFKRMDAQVLFYHDGNNCLVPFIMKHPQVAEIRIAALEKNKQNEWQMVTLINGFELEAILAASTVKGTSDHSFADIFLPVKIQQSYHGQNFNSKLSDVQIHTIVSGNGARTAIDLPGLGFRYNLFSKHVLYAKV